MEPIYEHEEEEEETTTEDDDMSRPLADGGKKQVNPILARIKRRNGEKVCGLMFLMLCVGFGVSLSAELLGDARPVRAKVGSCDHPVYCKGSLLHNVQTAQLFNDSKTFVDMPIKTTVDIVLRQFDMLPNKTDPTALKKLITDNFLEAGWDVRSHNPVDWHPNPPFLSKIRSPEYQQFAASIHSIWKDLSRVYNHSTLCRDCYSSVPLPNPFIVPGGRFREFYYWDTYWILEGLYISKMHSTARGILINFVTIIEKYGFFPNGARIYYLNRSQPPLFATMVERYLQETGDDSLLAEALDAAIKELNWWLQEKNRVTVDGHVFNYYHVEVDSPRPESYIEDVNTVKGLNSSDQIKDVWSGIASAAESGWDFSSRWLREPESNNLKSVATSKVVPVDLNVFVYKSLRLVAQWARDQNDPKTSDMYTALADLRQEAIQTILWDSPSHQWKDYNLTSQKLTQGRYPSNFTPLWADIMPPVAEIERILAEIDQTILQGGVPTSWTVTGQQWDMPDAWAPLQHIIMQGALNTAHPKGHDIAQKIGSLWIASNYCGWSLTGGAIEGLMFEKYNATHPGVPGDGGEYDVQEGFGWTNGVALWILDRFGSQLADAPTVCKW
eukprot:TRINITY_DN3524_c0_g2_i3.p1 TRINITY_DN3524_c0_g2~~TRINITY_DN3524_c0_g2_i3.p1  ORF type:complete len:612 (+),score=115.43 TRINITY_DN3524_c0_g2_i3:321-2156(+)